MTTPRRNVGPYPRWYLSLLSVCLLVAGVAFVIAAVGYLTNARQDTESREEFASLSADNARLIGCLDEYAAESTATSRAVRESSVDLADATTARDVALDAVFVVIATDPENEPRLTKTFGRLLATNAALVEAQADLARVRAQNPVPDAPSTFCGDDR